MDELTGTVNDKKRRAEDVTVLVVDDEPDVAFYLGSVLEDAGLNPEDIDYIKIHPLSVGQGPAVGEIQGYAARFGIFKQPTETQYRFGSIRE